MHLPASRSSPATLALVLLAPLAARAAETAAEKFVLPPIEVNAAVPLPPEERWSYARVAGFEVLAKVADRAARPMVTDLQKFAHALGVIYSAIADPSAQTLDLVLVHTDDFRALSPVTADAIAPDFSVYYHGSERSVIVVDMDGGFTATANLPEGSGDTVSPFRQLHRQYLRHLLVGRNATLPGWLEEGLTQVIADIELRGKWLTFGKVDTEQNMPMGDQPDNLGVPDPLAPNPMLSGLSFKQVFERRSFLPFDQFFAARLPDGSLPSSDSTWAKQAYAFVHFCLFGNKLRYQAPLIKLAERLRTEPLTEELFTACFGVNYRRMQQELRRYLVETRHKYQRYPLKPGQQAQPEPAEFRPATPAEAGLLKGETLLLAGRATEAHETHRLAYARGARTPDFLAAYAASCARIGDQDRARKLVNAAVAAGTSRPSAFVLQARLRFDEFAAAAATADGKFSDAQVASVLGPLFKARSLRPQLPETYDLIAGAWSRSATPPTPANLAVLDEGIRAFPRDDGLLLLACTLYHRIGDTAKAASIARLGQRFAGDPETRARFELLAGEPAVAPQP
ncbi:MAG TPA: hypothetical protein VG734_11305 [Lacunisphaera sp.]|nr:hypothetical protein [Lacunisphaera sp.]